MTSRLLWLQCSQSLRLCRIHGLASFEDELVTFGFAVQTVIATP